MDMFFKGARRSLSVSDIESLCYPGAITATVESYLIDGEIIIKTSCPRVERSRTMFSKMTDFTLPTEADFFMVVEPVTQEVTES